MNLPVDQVLRQGIEAHKAGQIQAADRFYRSFLQDNPADPDANFYLGLLAVDVGYPESSLPHFKRALKCKPAEVSYWLAMVDALIKSGQTEQAAAVLREGRDIGLKDETIAQIAERLEPENKRRPVVPDPKGAPRKEQVSALIALFRRGRLQEALDRTAALINLFPNDVILHNIMGGAHASLGQIDAAIESFDRALSINPDFSEAHYNRANALKEKGELAAAIESFRDAIRLRPVFAEAHNNLGITLQECGDLAAAIESFNQAIAIAPDFAEAHNNLGNAAMETGDLAAAIEGFNRALQIEPDFAEAHNNLGNALKEKGKFELAIESFDRALRIVPDFAEALNNRGIALQEKGDLPGAIESYHRALRLRPDFAEAFSNLGDAQKATGDLTSAVGSFKRALEIKPDFPEAYANLGAALNDSGDPKGAVECLERAVKIQPDFPEARYNLRRCYQVSNQYEEALREFRLTDHEDAEAFELDCLYLLDRKDEFIAKNLDLCRRRVMTPLLGCLGCHAEIRYETKIPNSFCSDPLAYVRNKPVDDRDFIDAFIAEIPNFKNGMRGQPLLENGSQSAGNIFLEDHDLLRHAAALIRAKIGEYRSFFADSTEPFLTDWPESYAIHGWLVRMESGGFLKSHIHESGWISGTLYLKVPQGLAGNQGNISFSTHGGVYPQDGKVFPERLVKVEQGSLNLFPSSLFHHTIPFNSDAERISLAFDVIPL